MLGKAEAVPLKNAGQAESQSAAPPPAVTSTSVDPRIDRIRQHLSRYRDLASQGKWAEAGRELEAIQNEVQK
jgi:hypothetical protein